jgi:hypothetical protein
MGFEPMQISLTDLETVSLTISDTSAVDIYQYQQQVCGFFSFCYISIPKRGFAGDGVRTHADLLQQILSLSP